MVSLILEQISLHNLMTFCLAPVLRVRLFVHEVLNSLKLLSVSQENLQGRQSVVQSGKDERRTGDCQVNSAALFFSISDLKIWTDYQFAVIAANQC